ncbi:hypothetical protein EJB05_11307, partial [Eragrostis curvula]
MHAFPTSDNVPAREISCRQQDAGRDREEKSGGEWPQGILSIGTLGNESPPHAAAEGGASSLLQGDLPDFTIEEVKKLQDALNKLLRRAKSKSSARGSAATDDDRQLPARQVDRRLSLRHAAGENGEFSPDTQIILSKARDLLVNSNGAASSRSPSSSCSRRFRLPRRIRARAHLEGSSRIKNGEEEDECSPSSANAASSRKYYLEDKPKREDAKGSSSCLHLMVLTQQRIANMVFLKKHDA